MTYENLFGLKGKVAVVTGGAGLLGKEIIRGLAEFSATAIIADSDKKKANKIVDEYGYLGENVLFYPLDITKEDSISKLLNFIDKKFGRLDIWVNNAYPRTSDWAIPFEGINKASWRANVDMHLSGYMSCCQKCAEYMKMKKSGVIVNMASIYGIVGPDFSIYKNTLMTMPAAYAAIKGGIIAFTKYLASYYGRYNLRINCVSPGGVHNKQPVTFVKKYAAKVPLGRMALKEDIVGAVLYLVSDASKYVTGHNLVVDGGWSAI